MLFVYQEILKSNLVLIFNSYLTCCLKIWLNNTTNHTIPILSGLSAMLYFIVIDKMVSEMAFMTCLIGVILAALTSDVICSRRVEIWDMLYEFNVILFGDFSYRIPNIKWSGQDAGRELCLPKCIDRH